MTDSVKNLSMSPKTDFRRGPTSPSAQADVAGAGRGPPPARRYGSRPFATGCMLRGCEGDSASLEAQLGGLLARLITASHVEFGEYGRNVVVDCPGGHHETPGDLGVAQAIGKQREHFDLTVA